MASAKPPTPSAPLPPPFTEQDEQRELATLSAAEIANAEADLIGVTSGFASLTLEEQTKKLSRATALACLDEGLSMIPSHEKSAYLQAVARCPELVNDNHRIAFLEREDFNVKLAAQRLVSYWETRNAVFGTERCFLPLTLRGAMKDEAAGMLKYCPLQLLTAKDTAGRAIIFFDSSRRDTANYSSNSMLMAFWYLVEAATEDPEVRKRGVVLIMHVAHAQRKDFDPIAGKFIANAFWGVSSVPCRSIHICQPNFVAYFVIYPIMKYVIGKDFRLRLKLHYGSEQEVLCALEKYCLPRGCVPSELGGDLVLNSEKWLNDRFVLESPQIACQALNTEGRAAKRMRSESTQCAPKDDDKLIHSMPPLSIPSIDPSLLHAVGSKKKVGRKADPRMNRAVTAKLANPDMPAYEALIIGGFEFPHSALLTDKSLDLDNVSLKQRRDQLSRRIRQSKKRGIVVVGESAVITASKESGSKVISSPDFPDSLQSANEASSDDMEALPDDASNLVDNDRKGLVRRDSFFETIMELPGMEDLDDVVS